MKKAFLALILAVFALAAAPDGARAVGITLTYTINYHPPSPCLAGDYLTGNIGLFEPGRGGYSSVGFQPGPPTVTCGGSSSGSLFFDAAVGTDIYLSFVDGYSSVGNVPVYAFDEGTTRVDAEPSSAPFVLIGSVSSNGIVWANPGPPELPLFAFSSPGTEVGSINIAMAAVPEPSTMLLLGSGLAGAGLLRWRRRAKKA